MPAPDTTIHPDASVIAPAGTKVTPEAKIDELAGGANLTAP